MNYTIIFVEEDELPEERILVSSDEMVIFSEKDEQAEKDFEILSLLL